MATQQTLPAQSMPEHKIGFSFAELPNAVLGFFGIRTEAELPYETILQDDAFSLRNYPEHSEVRTEAVGTRKDASNKSFSRLFAYIQGENWDTEKFAMTTPVIQRPNGNSRWSMSFFMKGRVEELPLPKTSAVKLYAVAPRTLAVIEFSGVPTDASVAEHTAALREWLAERDINAVGEPEVAQFDQPFSIPFLRKNEIHIPVESL